MSSVGKKKPTEPVNGTMTMVRGGRISHGCKRHKCGMKPGVTGMRVGLRTGRTSKDSGIRNGRGVVQMPR